MEPHGSAFGRLSCWQCERSGFSPFFPRRVGDQKGQGGTDRMCSSRQAFSEETLTELLRALRARTSEHPDNPGLVASWPSVRENRMDEACAELVGRGHPLFRVAIPGRSRHGWAIRGTTDA
jgi:hypothetical protein